MLKEEQEYIDLIAQRKIACDKAIAKIDKIYAEKIRTAKETAKINCKHNFFTTYNLETDSGYGQFWTDKVKRCRICGEEDVYNIWPLKE